MKSFNAKKTITILLFLLCLSFCSCKSETLPESPDISESGLTDITSQTAADTVVTKDSESGSEETKEENIFDPLVIKEEDFNFTPILAEDDIEYMGIPYKELTQEQFIQLWAQASRECNVQRLYNLYYSNRNYDETLSDEEKAKLSDEDIKDWMQMLLALELQGRMLHGYYDVELHEIEDAPEGYYDNRETEELRYIITYKNKMYEQGELNYEGNEIRWITLKKINGYWKIGLSFSSSP